MTPKILARKDYGRLVGTSMEPAIDILPADTDVIVVEEDDGTIVACSSIFARDHVEFTWIAEAHRNSPKVFWSLFQAIKTTAKRRGSDCVVTASMDDRLTAFLLRLHAEQLPGQHFVWPLVRES